MYLYNLYKEKIHFSLNFYSLFLLVTFIPDIVGLPPSVASNGLWALRAVTSLVIIIGYHKKVYHLSPVEKLFVFVSGVYLINLFVDIFWQYYPLNMGSPRDFVGFCLCILVAFSLRYYPMICKRSSFMFFCTTLALGLVVALFLAVESPAPYVGRYDANSTVNTINYGQMGCAMSIVAFYGFSNFRFRYSSWVYPILFVLGVVSIMKAGSRSPVVVLACVILFYLFARGGFVKGLLFIGVFATVFYFSLDLIIEISNALGSGIVERLVSAVETGETSGRDAIYLNAIQNFLDSPLFGDYYLVSSGIGSGGYPHNFFIEAFMTTGLIGGIPYLILVAISVYRSFELIKLGHESGWIALLFLQTLVYGMFSSSLYSSQDFWALSFFLLSIGPETLKKMGPHKKRRPKENRSLVRPHATDQTRIS